MVYDIKQLTPNLYFITWCGFPTGQQVESFIKAIEQILNRAEVSISFISDLRQGYIKDAMQIARLAHLSQHPRWGHGAAFGKNGAQVFAGVFNRMVRRHNRHDEAWGTLSEAITYLEKLEPGLTQGVDWAGLTDALGVTDRAGVAGEALNATVH
jgi:hypothetical protein